LHTGRGQGIYERGRIDATEALWGYYVTYSIDQDFRTTRGTSSTIVSILDKFMFVQSKSGDDAKEIVTAEFMFVPKSK
jgi:hypothetical protein